jgi:hypothetical protein
MIQWESSKTVAVDTYAEESIKIPVSKCMSGILECYYHAEKDITSPPVQKQQQNTGQ